MAAADKRGYLWEDFRLFHLKDSRAQTLREHYHEFDKLVLCLSGHVTYTVEGVTYFLQPWDMLLVGHGLIHRVEIDPSEPYERVVIWLGRDWLDRLSTPEVPLSSCFDLAARRNFHQQRVAPPQRLSYMRHLQSLEDALHSREFGSRLMAETLCQQLLILLNRDLLRDNTAQQTDAWQADPKIEEVLRYIAGHLAEPLDVDTLARRVFLSRYYLMHRFKAVTGYTLHQYVTQKRLLQAGELIRSGEPVMKAAEQAGFQDYSTFLRSFRATFHTSPREFYGQNEKRDDPSASTDID